MKLSEAVHSLIKDLQNWKTRKRTESLINETKILQKLSAVFDKIDSFNGVNIRGRWRVPVGNGTLKTAVPDVDSDIIRRFREDPIAPGQKLSNRAMVNPKPNLCLKDAMQSDKNDVTPTVVKTTTGSWSVTSFLQAFFSVTLSWLGLWKKIANWMGIQKHDSADLINTCEVLLSALVTVTRTVMETSAEIKIILETHLSKPLHCHATITMETEESSTFFTTAEELVQISEFQQKMSTKPKKIGSTCSHFGPYVIVRIGLHEYWSSCKGSLQIATDSVPKTLCEGINFVNLIK